MSRFPDIVFTFDHFREAASPFVFYKRIEITGAPCQYFMDICLMSDIQMILSSGLSKKRCGKAIVSSTTRDSSIWPPVTDNVSMWNALISSASPCICSLSSFLIKDGLVIFSNTIIITHLLQLIATVVLRFMSYCQKDVQHNRYVPL